MWHCPYTHTCTHLMHPNCPDLPCPFNVGSFLWRVSRPLAGSISPGREGVAKGSTEDMVDRLSRKQCKEMMARGGVNQQILLEKALSRSIYLHHVGNYNSWTNWNRKKAQFSQRVKSTKKEAPPSQWSMRRRSWNDTTYKSVVGCLGSDSFSWAYGFVCWYTTTGVTLSSLQE